MQLSGPLSPMPIGPDLVPSIWTDVVEVSLLLPKNRADALLALSKERQESVGQLLRDLIEGALGASLLPGARSGA